jgi:hypothetical protein
MKPAADDFDFIARRLKELRPAPAPEPVSQRAVYQEWKAGEECAHDWQSRFDGTKSCTKCGVNVAPSALADLCLASEDGGHWFDVCGRCNHCGEFRT